MPGFKRQERVMRNADAREIKIAYIGGGSRGWAWGLMKDLALCPHLKGRIALYDIDYAAAASNARIAETIFRHAQSKTYFRATAERTARAALRGADVVVCSIEPGPMTMRYADLQIPARYGIVQPVGDTVGPGGLMRALRAVPVYVEYARLIAEVCPKAWVINYTNPMTLCTAALYAGAPEIRAFGCCHEVFGTQHRLSRLVEQWFRVPRPKRHDIQLDITGVNHFTFATAAAWNGHDLMPRLRRMVAGDGFFRDRSAAARARREKREWFSSDGLIAFDFLRRFGALGAAGDRHLAEFVPWYLGSEKEIERWGVILTPYAWRIRDARAKAKRRGPKLDGLSGTGEEGVLQILGLMGLQSIDTNVNLPNRGQAPDLPAGAVVETYAQFRRDSLKPVVSRPMPPALAAVMRKVVDVQRLTLEAAIDRDRDLAFQALLNDPLVRLPTDRAWKMFNEMLAWCRPMLRGWRT
jgi:alpha-galactosidase